jgi:benzodiazapine receptor
MQNIFKVNSSFKITKLIISLAVTLGAGVIGSLFSMNSKGVYYSLNLPSFAPPANTFGIVWTLLFIIMGIAFYRVWMYYTPDNNNQSGSVKDALIYFIVQLIFNVLWSILFFGLYLKTAALFDVVILLFYIIVTTIKFNKIDKIAAYMMIPYIIWVAFATILNMSIIFLN